MDRRQKKTRNAIFSAFSQLLSQKDFTQITVADIIELADVGRATFYAHFETKDFLLKAFCEELFCHIFDTANGTEHRHIFHCDGSESVFLHLFQHLQKNDNNILVLLSSRNNELFLQYFRGNLKQMVESQLPLFAHRKDPKLPDSFWLEHIISVYTNTVKWWIANGMQESPEKITSYFLAAV